jgi:L-2,4-diaminobutyrate transaminase
VELMADPDARTFFDASEKVGARIVSEMAARGVVARAMPEGDIIGYAPPFCLSREEADTIVSVTRDAVEAVLPAKAVA